MKPVASVLTGGRLSVLVPRLLDCFHHNMSSCADKYPAHPTCVLHGTTLTVSIVAFLLTPYYLH